MIIRSHINRSQSQSDGAEQVPAYEGEGENEKLALSSVREYRRDLQNLIGFDVGIFRKYSECVRPRRKSFKGLKITDHHLLYGEGGL